MTWAKVTSPALQDNMGGEVSTLAGERVDSRDGKTQRGTPDRAGEQVEGVKRVCGE